MSAETAPTEHVEQTAPEAPARDISRELSEMVAQHALELGRRGVTDLNGQPILPSNLAA